MCAGRRFVEWRGLAALALSIAAAAAGTAWAAEALVTQKNRAFSTDRIVLQAGDVLVIRNEDTRAHNIQVTHPLLSFNSGLQEPGEDARIRFAEPEEYLVYCGIHPKMKLRVEVR